MSIAYGSSASNSSTNSSGSSSGNTKNHGAVAGVTRTESLAVVAAAAVFGAMAFAL
jgi:hypothetical protein